MYTSNLKWMRRDNRVMKRDKEVSNTPENNEESLKKQDLETNSKGLNDIGFRLVLIPFFGIAIPLLTNMMENLELSKWNFKLSFLYSIGIAWIVWEGNRFLLFTLRNYFDWYEKPIRKVGALLLVVPFYTIPISVLLLYGWYGLFANSAVEWSKIWLATAIILICVLFIVHVYETVFLVKEAESEKVMNARLERAKAEAELQTLKNQIDPHFIFNSLNTLSHLIEKDPLLATHFNQKLSNVYRYILQNRDRNFVFLGEEIKFVEDYISMLKTRYDSAVQIKYEIDKSTLENFIILPISLQLLIENAVKHNEFSDKQPLCILIEMKSDFIEVTNPRRIKVLKTTSGLGLKNLDERCMLLMERSITIQEDKRNFMVRVPLQKV